MKHAWLLVTMVLACRHHADSHEKDDDSKKEGSRTAADDKRTAAEEAIHAYETAGSCEARAQTIVYGASHSAQLGASCVPRKVERYDTAECDKLAGALSQCHATARRDGDKARYWLVKQANGQFLVDFMATERPVQLADLVAHLPRTPSVVRVRVRPGASYKAPFRDKAKTHEAYRVRAANGDRDSWGFAYVARDSPAGIALASAAGSRNDWLDVTVAISFPTNVSEVMVIDQVFGTDFFETEAEHEFGKSNGGT